MQALLTQLTSLLIRRPAQVAVVTVFITTLLSVNILKTPLDLSFVSVFGDESALMSNYVEMSKDVGLSRRLLLLVEGPDEVELTAAAESLADRLRESEDVDYVIDTPPTEWLRDNSLWVLPPEAFSKVLSWIESQDSPDAWKALEDAILDTTEQSSPLKVDGAQLMMVGLATDPLNVPLEDVVAGKDAFAAVEQIVDKALESYPEIQGNLTGLGALASQDQRATLESIGLISPLGLLLVLVLLRLVERSWIRLALIGLPLVLASGATLGLVGLTLGVITFTEAFFGVLVFGLGVDFALHLLIRLREERAKGVEYDQALTQALHGAGPGIILGALTTVAAFTVIARAPDPVARHLGVSGAFGILICLILMLTLLPACLKLLESRAPSRARAHLELKPLYALTQRAVESPKTTLLISLLLVGTALAGSTRFHFERDLQKLFNRGVKAVSTGERLKELFGTTNTPWVVASETEEEARRVIRDFENDPLFVHVDGISAVFPDPLSSRHEALTANVSAATSLKLIVEEKINASTALFKEPLYQRRDLIDDLLQAAQSGPPSLTSLPQAIRQGLLTEDGRFLTYAYTNFSGLDAGVLKTERERAEAIHPKATGLGAFIEGSLGGSKGWAIPVFSGIMAVVLVVLFLSFRDVRWVLVALTPVMAGTALTFGALCWLNVGFSVLLIVVVPLLVGLGVDDGIHIAHRLRHDSASTTAHAVSSVGHAILMTTLTTCAGVIALLFSNHPGMESMSLTLLIGLPSCLLASITLTPALAKLLRLRA